jgi:hypothetical protein
MSPQILEEDWLGDIAPPVNRGGRPAKGYTGRSRKIECPECGWYANTTARQIETRGFPTCACGGAIGWANMRDRIEFEDAAAIVADVGQGAYNDALAAAGYARETVKRDRQSGLGSARCQWQGGYCSVIVSGQYCSEHEPLAEITPARRAA